MKLKFKRDYLDFKAGKDYEVNPDSTAKYLIAMSIAKEVVAKDGKKAKVEPVKKAKVEPVKKAKVELVEPVEEAKAGQEENNDPDDLLGLFS